MEIMNNLIWFIDGILVFLPKMIIGLLTLIFFIVLLITPFLIIILPIRIQIRQWKLKRSFKDLYNGNLNWNDKIFFVVKFISFNLSIGTLLFLILPLIQLDDQNETSKKIHVSEVSTFKLITNTHPLISNKDYKWNPIVTDIQYNRMDYIENDSIINYRKNVFSINGFGIYYLSIIASCGFLINENIFDTKELLYLYIYPYSIKFIKYFFITFFFSRTGFILHLLFVSPTPNERN
jgi:hypothetical protein